MKLKFILLKILLQLQDETQIYSAQNSVTTTVQDETRFACETAAYSSSNRS